MKSIAYIHIGLEKTGTTTLQEFFFLNRDNLAKAGIHFMSSPGTKNHTDLAVYAYDKTLGDLIIQKNLQTPEARDAFRESFLVRFKSEIQQAKTKDSHLLVSCEHLSSRVFSKDEIRKLLGLFIHYGYQAKVIVYLRRQDQYLLSTYSTWLKSGAMAELNENAYKRKRYDYLSLLEMWSEVIGDDNMIVKIFERNQMYKQDLLQDFLMILGIKQNTNYIEPPKNLNKSLDTSKLQFLKSINSLIPSAIDGHKNPLRGELVKVLEQMDNNGKLSLKPELSQRILDYYSQDNKAIQERYFPNQTGTLFNEKIREKTDESTEEQQLTVDKLYEITSALWNHQQGVINHLTERCRELENRLGEIQNGNVIND